jgi:glycosyltransferase involved in cell wall biosynthesis
MKILMVTRNFAGNDSSSGGIENYLGRLCRQLMNKNKVVVVSASRNAAKSNYSLDVSRFMKIKVIKIVRNFISPMQIYKDPLFFIRDRKIEDIFGGILDAERPDIVHIHHLGELSFGLVKLIKGRNIPVIITLHDLRLIRTHTYLYSSKTNRIDPKTSESFFPVFYRRRIKYAIERKYGGISAWIWLTIILFHQRLCGIGYATIDKMRLICAKDALKNADMLLAPSRFVKNIYSRFIDPKKIMVADLGIVPSKRSRKKSPRNIRFGYVGGLMPHKGIDILLSAFASIKPNDSQLYLYGDDMSSALAKGYARKYSGMNNISFKSIYHDIGKVLSNIDVMVVPSICDETFSLAAHEALSAQIPVIASRCGAFPEYIRNGVNGFLFPPADHKRLSAVLEKVIRRPSILNTIRPDASKILSIREDSNNLTKIYAKMTRNK